jgi:hypothetical protein
MTKSYSVSISNPGLTGNANGFIDNKRIEQYTPEEITVDQAIAKKRANIRYNAIIMGVGLVSNPTVDNIVADGASEADEGSEFNMNMTFVSEESLAIIRDEERLEGVDALKRLIAEAISAPREATVDYYHATKLASVALLTIAPLAADADAAESLITITEL